LSSIYNYYYYIVTRYIYTGSSDGSVWVYDILSGSGEDSTSSSSWQLDGFHDEAVRDGE